MPATKEDFSRGPVAQNVYEADRNASNLNGRDWDGYRHRGNYVAGGELPFAGSLQDAQAEIATAILSQGDYLDFGPEQVGGKRFSGWASVKRDIQSDRGIVVRVVLLCGLISTSKELDLAGFYVAELKKHDDTFRDMTAAQFWEWVEAQRKATAGTPGAGASGNVGETPQPATVDFESVGAPVKGKGGKR